MELSEKATAQVISIDSCQDDRRQVLEKAIGTVDALKRLIAAYDRLKEERDNFERDLSKVSAGNEALRKQANDAEVNRDRLSQIVTTFVGQMETIGASCTEAAKVARVYTSDAGKLRQRVYRQQTPGCLRIPARSTALFI
jgi:FtsZ-binding cell division protein ZapB